MKAVILFGGGGHCASVIDALEASGNSAHSILDDDQGRKGEKIAGVPIQGSLAEASGTDLEKFPIIVSIARNRVRQQVVRRLTALSVALTGVRHPSAVVSRRARIDPTAQIMAGAIVNSGAVIGAHAVLNSGCIVEHDAVIGEFVHIGPGASLAGAVVVEEGVFVAIGASLGPSVRIGAWSTLGAGAVALRDVPAGVLALGVPARIVRNLADSER
jgi:acetyltransferase EpsM